MTPSTVKQERALQILALAALATLLWIARPVGVGLFLGVLSAFAVEPLHARLRARWAPRVAALACVLATVSVVAVTCTTFVFMFVTRGVALARSLPQTLARGGATRELAERGLAAVHVDSASAFVHLETQAANIESRAATLAAGVAGATVSSLLTLLFMSLAMYYVLRHWSDIVVRAELDLPLDPRHTRALFGQFRKVGGAVLRGTVVTGAIQGMLACIGYWTCGVPNPIFLGALTAAASVVPGVGTTLVWTCAGVYLIGTHHVAAGIIELVYGVVVVGVITDYVIRPRLVGANPGVPAVLTFVSLFGGVEVFGVVGLIVGPVIVTLCVAVLKTYEDDLPARNAS